MPPVKQEGKGKTQKGENTDKNVETVVRNEHRSHLMLALFSEKWKARSFKSEEASRRAGGLKRNLLVKGKWDHRTVWRVNWRLVTKDKQQHWPTLCGVSSSRGSGKVSCWVYPGLWYYQDGFDERMKGQETLILGNFYGAHYYDPGAIRCYTWMAPSSLVAILPR